ncbi:PREDICTED: C-C motif chemokine 5-like [Mesitornis unicolor]|uniref:C-C motif chemokine 5-like n=1 Tax=Mesitornis unicolor TaxID=54374 RepID=UPI000528A482|nr:PREDICTED: C-C motif chemokine 5-like [Mesitornis unicolor]
MKVPAVTLAALLIMAICSPAEAHPIPASLQDLDNVPSVCCLRYLSRPIPQRRITSVYTTSSACSQPAVILVTKTGRELCANPQEAWVQQHVKHFQKPKN